MVLILAAKQHPALLIRLCGPNVQGCSSTLYGSYHSFLGVDLAWWGLAFFLLALVVDRRPVTVFGALAGLLSLAVQMGVLHALCVLCLFAAGALLGMALPRRLGYAALALPLLLGALGWVDLRAPEAPARLSLDPALRTFLRAWQPGEPGGGELTILFDYACHHCLAMLPQLDSFAQAHPDVRIELLYLPTTPNASYRAAGQIALAAGDFPSVHRDLCARLLRGERIDSPPNPPDLAPLEGLAGRLGVRSLPQFYRNGRRAEFPRL